MQKDSFAFNSSAETKTHERQEKNVTRCKVSVYHYRRSVYCRRESEVDRHLKFFRYFSFVVVFFDNDTHTSTEEETVVSISNTQALQKKKKKKTKSQVLSALADIGREWSTAVCPLCAVHVDCSHHRANINQVVCRLRRDGNGGKESDAEGEESKLETRLKKNMEMTFFTDTRFAFFPLRRAFIPSFILSYYGVGYTEKEVRIYRAW